VELISHGHPENKATGLGSHDHIKIHILYHFQELVNGQMKALSIL